MISIMYVDENIYNRYKFINPKLHRKSDRFSVIFKIIAFQKRVLFPIFYVPAMYVKLLFAYLRNYFQSI